MPQEWVLFAGFTEAPRDFYTYQKLAQRNGLDIKNFRVRENIAGGPGVLVNGDKEDIDKFGVDVLVLHHPGEPAT